MKERWSCGHMSEAMCGACFLDLADKANGWRALADQYADTILKLRAEIERLKAERAGDQHRLFHYERLLAEAKP